MWPDVSLITSAETSWIWRTGGWWHHECLDLWLDDRVWNDDVTLMHFSIWHPAIKGFDEYFGVFGSFSDQSELITTNRWNTIRYRSNMVFIIYWSCIDHLWARLKQFRCLCHHIDWELWYVYFKADHLIWKCLSFSY